MRGGKHLNGKILKLNNNKFKNKYTINHNKKDKLRNKLCKIKNINSQYRKFKIKNKYQIMIVQI